MKYIHGDVKEYFPKVVSLEVLGHTLWCRAGVVSQLDCPALIRRLSGLEKTGRIKGEEVYAVGRITG